MMTVPAIRIWYTDLALAAGNIDYSDRTNLQPVCIVTDSDSS